MVTNTRTRIGSTSALTVFAAAVLVSAFVFVAPYQAANAQSETKLRIALVTDALFSDGGWGAAAYTAAQKLKDQGHEVTAGESIAIEAIESTLRQY